MRFEAFDADAAAEMQARCVPFTVMGGPQDNPDLGESSDRIPLLRLESSGHRCIDTLIGHLHHEQRDFTVRLPGGIFHGGHDPWLLIRVEISAPIVCNFNILLRWNTPDHREVLTLMARHGQVIVFVGAAYPPGQAIGLHIPPQEIQTALRAWDTTPSTDERSA